MADLNVVAIVGRLTRDPEVKYGKSGAAYCNYSVATSRRVKNGNEWSDKSVYVDCVCFGKTAEMLNRYGRKGSMVSVNGELDFDSWEDKVTKQKRSKMSLFTISVNFLGKSGQDDQRPYNTEYGEESQERPSNQIVSNAGGPPPTDDVPF